MRIVFGSFPNNYHFLSFNFKFDADVNTCRSFVYTRFIQTAIHAFTVSWFLYFKQVFRRKETNNFFCTKAIFFSMQFSRVLICVFFVTEFSSFGDVLSATSNNRLPNVESTPLPAVLDRTLQREINYARKEAQIRSFRIPFHSSKRYPEGSEGSTT